MHFAWCTTTLLHFMVVLFSKLAFSENSCCSMWTAPHGSKSLGKIWHFFSLQCFTEKLAFQIHDRDKCQIYISRTHVPVGNLFSSLNMTPRGAPLPVSVLCFILLWRSYITVTNVLLPFFLHTCCFGKFILGPSLALKHSCFKGNDADCEM